MTINNANQTGQNFAATSGSTTHDFESDLNGWTDGRSGSYLTFGRATAQKYHGSYSLNIGAEYGRNRRGTGVFTEE